MFDFILPPDEVKPIIILDDRGGRVRDYLKAAQTYTDQKREVRIIGLCRSACSLALSVPEVCVGPMATVMFHDAYDLKSGKINLAVTKEILDKMPPKIREVVSATVHKEFRAAATLDAKKLIKLGIRQCDKELD